MSQWENIFKSFWNCRSQSFSLQDHFFIQITYIRFAIPFQKQWENKETTEEQVARRPNSPNSTFTELNPSAAKSPTLIAKEDSFRVETLNLHLPLRPGCGKTTITGPLFLIFLWPDQVISSIWRKKSKKLRVGTT